MLWPGRILGADEIPPLSVLSFVDRQLDVPEAAWCDYGRRAPTRRAHLTDLARRLLERLDHARAIGLAPARAATIPAAAFERIADEAVRITSQHLAQLPDRRRHALLAAAALRLHQSLADAVLTMMNQLLGSIMRRAENPTRDKALGTIRALQTHLRLLIGARAQGLDSLAAMAIDWEKLGTAVGEAEILVAPETTDRTAEFIDRHRSLRGDRAVPQRLHFPGCRSGAGAA